MHHVSYYSAYLSNNFYPYNINIASYIIYYSAYLSDHVLDQFIHSEANVGINTKHLPHGILIDTSLHVTIQHTLHHVKEVRVVLLWFHFTYKNSHQCQINKCLFH